LLNNLLLLNINLGNNDNQVVELNLRSVEDRLNFLKELIPKALSDFRFHQKPAQVGSLRSNPCGKMQKRYHLLGFDDLEISTTFVIDIGRFLGFRKPVNSDSWHLAGSAYLLVGDDKSLLINTSREQDAELVSLEFF